MIDQKESNRVFSKNSHYIFALSLILIAVINIILIIYRVPEDQSSHLIDNQTDISILRDSKSHVKVYDNITKSDNLSLQKEILTYDNLSLIDKRVYLKPKAAMSIIIDDIGNSFDKALEIWKIDKSITLSVIPHLKDSVEISQYAKEHNLSLMLHIPMEPMVKQGRDYSFYLTTFDSEDDFIRILRDALDAIPFYQGINNHEGSKLTSDIKRMNLFFRNLDKKRIFFIDSRTSNKSVAAKVSVDHNYLTGVRDVFIDNEQSVSYILDNLKKAEQIALKKGYAIAIGHPHKESVEALKLFCKKSRVKIIKPNEGLMLYKELEIANIRKGSNESSDYRYRH